MLRSSWIRSLIGLCLLATAGLPARADVLLLDQINATPANTYTGLPRPFRGMNMAEVEATYGPPLEKFPAVGDPPITRWLFDGFTVYFEGDGVLHSVVHRGLVSKMTGKDRQ